MISGGAPAALSTRGADSTMSTCDGPTRAGLELRLPTWATTLATLPKPGLGPDAALRDYLQTARAALIAGETGKAQQSLEMAETRALDGAVSLQGAPLPEFVYDIVAQEGIFNKLVADGYVRTDTGGTA